MIRTPEQGIPDGGGPAGGSGHADGATAAGPSSSVTTLRRPPVRQSTVARSDVRHTFEVFVKTIGIWWPVNPFSAGKDRVRDVVIEQRTGGRVHETWADGTEVDWGTLLVWDPPARFVMTWNQTPVPTEVELSFAALGPALTRITVEHRGWEALTDEQLAEDCALPGGYIGGSYSVGWVQILGRAAAALGPADTPGLADTPGPADTPGLADTPGPAVPRPGADAPGPADAPSPAAPKTTDHRRAAP